MSLIWVQCRYCGGRPDIYTGCDECDNGKVLTSAPEPAPTVRTMPLDPVAARDIARAAAQAKTWTEKRDRLMREAVAGGAGVREVARAADMSHATFLYALRKEPRGNS